MKTDNANASPIETLSSITHSHHVPDNDVLDASYSDHITSVCKALNTTQAAQSHNQASSYDVLKLKRRREADRECSRRRRKRRKEKFRLLQLELRRLASVSAELVAENGRLKDELRKEMSALHEEQRQVQRFLVDPGAPARWLLHQRSMFVRHAVMAHQPSPTQPNQQIHPCFHPSQQISETVRAPFYQPLLLQRTPGCAASTVTRTTSGAHGGPNLPLWNFSHHVQQQQQQDLASSYSKMPPITKGHGADDVRSSQLLIAFAMCRQHPTCGTAQTRPLARADRHLPPTIGKTRNVNGDHNSMM